MALPNKIRAALVAEMQDMLSWTILLNFFSEQQSQLSPTQKISIYEKCEDFLNFWNTDHITVVDIVRNSGEIVKMKAVRPSLKIDKNTINPKNIYTDSDILDYLQTKSDKKTQLIKHNKQDDEFLLDSTMATA